MAHRPSINKQIARVRKAMRATPGSPTGPLTFIEPVAWLKDHGHAQTSGQAKQLVIDGRLLAGGEPTGVIDVPARTLRGAFKLDGKGEIEMEKIPSLIPADLRSKLTVVPA